MHRPGRCSSRAYVPSGPRWRRKRWNSRARMSPEGTSSGDRSLLALGGLLEPFDERLDVGVALHGEADLALVVGRRRPRARRRRPRRRQAFEPAHERQRRLRVGGRGDVVGDARPQARRGQPGLRRRRCAGRRRSRSGPRSWRPCSPGARPATGRRRARSSPPGGCAGRRRAARPSETTSCTPSASARSTRCALNARQRIDGSTPWTSTRSRGARGARASKTSTVGQTISRASAVGEADRRGGWPGSRRTPRSRSARSGARPAPRRGRRRALEAASPASFQPWKAQTIAGALRPSGRRSQIRAASEPPYIMA